MLFLIRVEDRLKLLYVGLLGFLQKLDQFIGEVYNSLDGSVGSEPEVGS